MGTRTWRIGELAAAPDAEAAEPFLAAFRALEAADSAALRTWLSESPSVSG